MKYICPKCGQEVAHLMLPSNPPKTQNKCFNCGWSGDIKSRDNDEEIIAT